MENIEIKPFIYFYNLKSGDNYNKEIKWILKENLVRQIILDNWMKLSHESILEIYKLFRDKLIKFSLLIDDNIDIKKIEDISCNIYRVYATQEIKNQSVIKYFRQKHIEICLIISYSEFKVMANVSIFNRVYVDISMESRVVLKQCNKKLKQVIFFPTYDNGYAVLPFGYF